MIGTLRPKCWWVVVWLCRVMAVASVQPPFQSLKQDVQSRPDFGLSSRWTVLGPFPAGMRELPFGGFPASVYGSHTELLSANDTATYFSTYGTVNGTTSGKVVNAKVELEESKRIRQLLTVEYSEIDWDFIRSTAGWSGVQWQMIAMTDLQILQNNTAVAATFSKTAEFAVISAAELEPGQQKPIEWHTGDWYSYIDTLSQGGPDTTASLSSSHHLLHLQEGCYKVLVRSMYEVRIFGDPQNGNPRIMIGIDLSTKSGSSSTEKSVQAYTDLYHSNVPHVVGGWLAGWGLSFGLRATDSTARYLVQGVTTSAEYVALFSADLVQMLTIVPGQTLLIPVKMTQHMALPSSLKVLELFVTLRSTTNNGEHETFVKSVKIDLHHTERFWDVSSKEEAQNSFIYSYLATDGTVQVAAATPPKQKRKVVRHSASLPPVILAHHGAGADIRDLGFSKSVQRQEENWVISPTGRSPWGYDWQLASYWAAQAAVDSLHKYMYGLPPPFADSSSPAGAMSIAERATWDFDPTKIFVMGHSNGGQGAWYRLGRFPDLAIGGVVAAAYTKVSDYVSFGWKVGRHYQDAMMDGLLHSSLSMFENDLFASNLVGIDLLVKYGSIDDNVPPWNSRDMAMVADGWNRRSDLSGRIRIYEVPDRPHWWDTVFSENDVQLAIESKCSVKRNTGYAMPSMPNKFTVTVANPSESGSKGGWSITEVETPGRLAKLEVVYIKDGGFEIGTSNVVSASFQLSSLRRYTAFKEKITSVRINGHVVDNFRPTESSEIHLVKGPHGRWRQIDHTAVLYPSARPIGPIIRIVSSAGPISIIVPARAAAHERKVFQSIARRFAADLLLYGGLNAQIMSDVDFATIPPDDLPVGNIVTLGGPHVNTFTAKVHTKWPTQSPFTFREREEQFSVRDRPFYSNGTAVLALAPHPNNGQGLVLMLHGIGLDGIQRAARLLPTRTVTMVPEWIVVDSTSEWTGQGGVKAAGWYDRHWGWSEGMSYVD